MSARVVIADINAERGENAAKEMSANGAAIEFIEVNVTEESSQQALFDDVVRRYGQLDIVVAAAGISSANYVSGEVSTPAEDPEQNFLFNKPIADWQRVLDVNLTGVAITDRIAAQHMLALETQGSIINIASIAGRRPLPGAADYCVSKAGVIMLTNVFATELATKNIRVNAIGPGFIETPMTASIRQSPDWVQTVMQMTPMQRFGQAEEIANTALFLASDESQLLHWSNFVPQWWHAHRLDSAQPSKNSLL